MQRTDIIVIEYCFFDELIIIRQCDDGGIIMKVDMNISLYAGQDKVINHKEKGGNKNIFGGNLNLNQDPIEEKRKQAREQAMKVVTDTFANEIEIDAGLEERRNNISKLREEMKAANEEVNKFEQQKTDLKEAYGVADDSQEQLDLDLLIKEKKSLRHSSGITLTEEDYERLKEIKASDRTEYQDRVLEIEDYIGLTREEIDKNNENIKMENAIISGVKKERLKYSPMLDATQQADEILKAASDEIISMATEEAMEHIDDEFDEKVEAAKEKAEEKKIQEEKLEALKEKKEEVEGPELPYEDLLKLNNIGEEVKAEIDNIIQKMNLVEEDIKGALVDKKL